MGVYIPLKVRLAKASIPQVVAYIQTYLEENPIPSMDTFAQLIAQFLADHPELVAVASVNSKTGAVILTGADIMLNADADVTLETEVTNLNSMIASLSSQVAAAVSTVEGMDSAIDDINADIDTINVALDTKDTEIYQINQTLTNHLNGINANTTKNAQQDTRLTALENALDALESDYNGLNTQVTLHSQQITALQGMIGGSSEIMERLAEVEQTAENAETSVSAMQSSVNTLSSNVSTLSNTVSGYNSRISAIENQQSVKSVDLISTGFGTSDANVTISYTDSKCYRTGNIVYMNLAFTYNTSLPSSGYASINFTFTDAPFTIIGGFGNGLSGTTGHFAYISPSTFGVRITNTNAIVRLFMIVQ